VPLNISSEFDFQFTANGIEGGESRNGTGAAIRQARKTDFDIIDWNAHISELDSRGGRFQGCHIPHDTRGSRSNIVIR
jgi:hypothetical protein